MSFDLEVKKATGVMFKTAEKQTLLDVQSRMGAIVDVNVRDANDTGLLANSWEASIKSPIFNSKGSGPSQADAPESRKKIKDVSSKFKAGDTLYLTNSIEYALANELGIGMNPRRMLAQGVKFGGKDVIK